MNLNFKTIEEKMIDEIEYARESTEKEILADYCAMHELARNNSVKWGGKSWTVCGVLANDKKFYRVRVSGNDNYDNGKFDALMNAIENRFHPYTVYCVYA